MKNERVIENNSVSSVVTFSVLINGKEAEPEIQFMSISVIREANRIPTAKIVVRDGEAAQEDFPVSNKKFFAPGTEIEIKAGRDSIEETIFKGIVVKHSIKIGQQGNGFLKIECKDESVKLVVGRKNAYYENMSDKEVIKKILNEQQLKGKIEDTKGKHKELIQHHVNDWDFIVCRAEANGKLVLVEDGNVNIEAPTTDGQPVLCLIFGSTLYEFEAEMDARYQWKKVKASSWNYSDQKMLNAVSSQVPFQEPGNLTGKKLADVIGLQEFELRHSGQVLPEELQAWADASMLKSRLAKVRGRAKSIGVSKIKPGALVEMKGVGDRFNGIVYITGVRHELQEGNWYTNAQFGLGPQWFHEQHETTARPAAGLLPAIQGLQIGLVEQLHDDPEMDDRVLVKLPIIDKDAKGIWARVASLDAGNERGAFFRPEVNDEVVVGFINGDPRDAIILGMLNSKSLPAPLRAQQDNAEKGFVTREKIKLLFNDVDKVVTIETPGNNSAVISDSDQSITLKDQHGNKITMDANGITLDSSKDIIMNAKGSIQGTALQSASLEGNTGLSLQSPAGAIDAFGTAGAKLASGAVTELTGAAQVLIY